MAWKSIHLLINLVPAVVFRKCNWSLIK